MKKRELLRPGNVVVFDNVSAHSVVGVQAAIEAAGWVRSAANQNLGTQCSNPYRAQSLPGYYNNNPFGGLLCVGTIGANRQKRNRGPLECILSPPAPVVLLMLTPQACLGAHDTAHIGTGLRPVFCPLCI